MDLGSDASVLIFALFLLLHLNKHGNYLCKRNPFCILLMCLSRKFSHGGLASDKGWSNNFYNCNNQYFAKSRGYWTPYPPSGSADATIQGKLLLYSIMVEISKIRWESGDEIRSSKLHTNSVRACISLAPKQLSLDNELSREKVCMATAEWMRWIHS